MYTLFDITKADRKHTVVIPKFNHVKDILKIQSGKVEDYYRFHNSHFPSNHLLMRLILSLNVSLERDLLSFVAAAEDRTSKLAKTFKLIHPTNQNTETWNGTFYNTNTPEYIIASDDSFNVPLAWEKWESIVPVKIHSHPFTDMSIGIPNGKYPMHMTQGPAVISINIPMLALQYKAWVQFEQNRRSTSLRLESFIYNYVITNMVKRHNEICLINRTIAYCTETPINEFGRMHPFMVSDYSGPVDEVLIARDKYLSQRKVDFNQLFLVYDTLYFDTWAKVLKLPKMAPTRHSRWIYLLSYLPYIHFYLKVIQKQNARLDRHLVMSIRRHLMYMGNTRDLPANIDAFTGARLEDVRTLLDNLGA